MQEELLRILLFVRAKFRMPLPNQILEHGGPDTGL
jgi:hypothetical protein